MRVSGIFVKKKKNCLRDLSQMMEKGLKRISRPQVEDFFFFKKMALGHILPYDRKIPIEPRITKLSGLVDLMTLHLRCKCQLFALYRY